MSTAYDQAISTPARTAAATARPYGGKPPAQRTAERRERILHAARDVFAERGYAETVIEEIVARAHVSRTSFYEYFAGKEECLLAVFELGMERLGAAVLEAVARPGPPAQRIRIEVEAIAGAFATDPAMARVVLIGIVGATPAAEEARSRARQQAAELIEAQLAEYPYWSRRPADERRIASTAAMAAIAESIADLLARGRIADWEEIVTPVSEFVAQGLIRTP
jgi:AcrR family transcriptional regulator